MAQLSKTPSSAALQVNTTFRVFELRLVRFPNGLAHFAKTFAGVKSCVEFLCPSSLLSLLIIVSSLHVPQ
jgi:hypothetical protein